MNWSTDEKENLTKLMLSADENNRSLAIEILNQSEQTDEFADLLYFMLCCNYDVSEDENFIAVFNKISSKNKENRAKILDFLNPLRRQSKEQITVFLALYEASSAAIFEHYFSMAPHYVFLYNSLGNYLIRNKLKQKGLEYLEKAVRFNPNSYSNNFDYAFNLNESKKNAPVIIKLYEKCIEIDDFGIGPYHNIGRIYAHQLKQYKTALEVMKRGNDKFPCSND